MGRKHRSTSEICVRCTLALELLAISPWRLTFTQTARSTDLLQARINEHAYLQGRGQHNRHRRLIRKTRRAATASASKDYKESKMHSPSAVATSAAAAATAVWARRKGHSLQELSQARVIQCSRRRVLSGLATTPLAWAVQQAMAEGLDSKVTSLSRGEILKSPNDPRSYRAAKLGNGLKVLLASDPDAVTSAAALSVKVGFYSDPETLPGLAHFCEHMLFLGTKEYPEENSFERFLTANGGSQNAFTTESNTTYFFDVIPGALPESLRRFSSFFKDPLFTASATEREVNAIGSEFAKNRQSDSFRLSQILKSTAIKGHPERHFGCGNRQTLLQKGPEELRAALLRLFNEYYDPSQMALCVVGKESLDILQANVQDFFGSIQKHGTAVQLPSYGINPYPPLLSEKGGPLLLQAAPVGEARAVTVAWPITFSNASAREEWVLAKTYSYVGHIIGHEGPGSLQSLLKNKRLVNRGVCGIDVEQDDFALFKVSFDVSAEGLQRKDEIFGAIFSVVRRLQASSVNAVPEYMIEELKGLSEIRWRFAEKRPSRSLALEMVDEMQDETPEALLVSNRMLLLDPPRQGPSGGSLSQAVASFLQQLTPDRARYSVVAREVAPGANLSEPFYNGRYAMTEISPAVVEGWSKKPVDDLLSGWQLPPPNAFVAKDFSLVWPQALDRQKAASQPPELLRNDDRWRVFFKADRAFGVPKATVLVQLWFPEDMKGILTADGRVAARLWQLSLADRLSEDYYAARLAGLNVGFSNTLVGLSLSFSGYSDKLPKFVEEVLQRILNFDGPSASEFARALDELQREQAAFDVAQPFSHASYYSRLATISPEYTIESLREATSRASAGAVRDFTRLLNNPSQALFGQALIHGNLSRSSAARIERALADTLTFKGALDPGKDSPLLRARFAKLPAGQDVLQIRPEPNASNVNHAIVCIFWMGCEPKDGVKTELLQSILKDPFYGRLRTEQQLGYIVQSQSDRYTSLARLLLVVQSSVQSPERLLAAVDAFLAEFRSVLASLPDRELDRYKASLQEELLQPDQRLSSETGRWWGEITGFQYTWSRRAEEARLVDSISKTDLMTYYDERVAAGASQRRRNITAVFANTPQREADMAKMGAAAKAAGMLVVDEPIAFCNSAPKWPLSDKDLPLQVRGS
eukprot:TRINITY_DN94836_c0_g1_i1.p1 TRINITY_DN94836_c0_g1~~TRINITY_DN94836_c0_g1_i1.p1  ORF type:complete len:1155 (-),score=226.14 TRINITY_DN94836_c0_g1_i1:7-3471(-)